VDCSSIARVLHIPSLFKLGLINDPICERCQEEVESATHILCDCEAVAQIRFCHLGQFFMEPSDYYVAPIDKSYTSFEVWD
jgi:predicted amidophosphoribosyltransferase